MISLISESSKLILAYTAWIEIIKQQKCSAIVQSDLCSCFIYICPDVASILFMPLVLNSVIGLSCTTPAHSRYICFCV